MRVTDSATSLVNTTQINAQRGRLGVLQEQLASGKRINRPSDDPNGAEAVINLRTSQTEFIQFRRNAESVSQKLAAADDVLSSYEPVLDRLRALLAQGITGTTITPEAKNALATEIDALRVRILSTANTQNDSSGEYLFGGIRQNEPPFDPQTAAPSPHSTAPQYVQIEPGAAAAAVGVTANTIFADGAGTIFTDLTAAAAALRGTGDTAADHAALIQTQSRLAIYGSLAAAAHAQIGATANRTEMAIDYLKTGTLSFDTQASDIEGADFAATATQSAAAERSLEAVLQTTARGRRSLFDFLS